jgi:SecY
MLDLGGVRDRTGFARSLAVTAAALVAYRLGMHIPLPGFSAKALQQVNGATLERISILALGITPFVTILIFAELLKVIAPGVRRWEQAEAHNRIKLNRIVIGLSLLAAAAQASGLALALEDVTHLVDEPGTSFRLTCIATLVGGTAVVIWLADLITRHGLGSGTWLLLVAPWLADVLPRAAALAAWQHDASLIALELLVGCTLTALVLAATTAVVHAGASTLQSATTCLWSVLLAATAWPWLVLVIGLVASGGNINATGSWMSPANPFLLLALAGLVALFAHLYIRSQRIAGTALQLGLPPAVFAGTLAAIKFADMVLATQLAGLVPLAAHLILVAVVALSLLAQWWRPPFAAVAQPKEQ